MKEGEDYWPRMNANENPKGEAMHPAPAGIKKLSQRRKAAKKHLCGLCVFARRWGVANERDAILSRE
jgi:hypothetical protein